jgi:ribosomal protein L11 methyltransferase
MPSYLHRHTIQRTQLPVFQALADETAVALDVAESQQGDDYYDLTWILGEADDRAGFAALFALSAQAADVDADVDWQQQPDEDWQAKTVHDFPPFSVGKFQILRNNEAAAEGVIPLHIPAAMAFGTGEHATTEACLTLVQLLEAEDFMPTNILDMGCGSGILGMAAAKLWQVPVLCVDNDAPSVAACAENVNANDVADWVTVVHGEGFNTPEVQQNMPYDLIFANILANPLIDMAPALASVCTTGSTVILSGYLYHQRASVLAAYEAQGLVHYKALPIGDWFADVVRRA